MGIDRYGSKIINFWARCQCLGRIHTSLETPVGPDSHGKDKGDWRSTPASADWMWIPMDSSRGTMS